MNDLELASYRYVDTLEASCQRLSDAMRQRRRAAILDRTYVTRIVPNGATVALIDTRRNV
jgi:hypothetical protein